MPKSEPKHPSAVPGENRPAGQSGGTCPTNASIAITSQTQETDLPDRARKRIGVGERVTLTATPGPAQWSIVSGVGDLSAQSGASVDFTASEEAGTVQISAEGANGCAATIAFTVVAPSGVHLERVPGTKKWHTHKTRTTGMICEIWVVPADVSFKNVTFRELEAYAKGTGAFAAFASQNNVGHSPNPSSAVVDRVDPGKGSKIRGKDRIATKTTTTGSGTMTWSIPYEYSVNGALFPKTFANTVEQVATFESNGKVTLTKGGASVSSEFNDPTEKDPEFPI